MSFWKRRSRAAPPAEFDQIFRLSGCFQPESFCSEQNFEVREENSRVKTKRHGLLLAVFTLLGIGAAILSLCIGAAWLNPRELIQAVSEGTETANGRIFYYVRLPRTTACLLAGAGLAVAGAVIQNVLANRLASPGMIGVTSGAGLAVTICCMLGFLSGGAVAFASFAGAFLSVMLIAVVSCKTNASRSAVILGGVALNSFLSAISEAIMSILPDVGVLTADFRTGGFSGVSAARLLPAGIMIILGLILVCSLSNELDLLSMGEETAHGLGLSVTKIRTIFLLLAALLAGACVSFAGVLGFVGLIVPNMARKLTGGESKNLLPMCIVFGAGFVTLCDCIARTVFAPYEIATGIVMSAIGAPFFLYLLFQKKGGHARG